MTRYNTRTSILDQVKNGLIGHSTKNSGQHGVPNVVHTGDIHHSTDNKIVSTTISNYGKERNRADTSSSKRIIDPDMDPEGSMAKYEVPQTVMTPMVSLGRQSSQVSDDNDDLTSENVKNVSMDTAAYTRDDHTKVGYKGDVASTRKRRKKKNIMIEADGNDGEERKHKPPTPSTGARPKVPQIINTVRSFGYTDNEVATALIRLQGAHVEVTNDSLIDMSFDVRMESLQGPVTSGGAAEAVLTNGHTQLHGTTAIITNGTTPVATEEEVVREHRVKEPALDPEERYKRRVALALRNKKEELSDAIEALTYKCRVCNDADANILLLPCAHLVCCSNCVDDVRRCPLARCNRIVRGTKEIYYS